MTRPFRQDRLERATLAKVDSQVLLRELLRRIGEDPDREGLQQTPARIIRSWSELFSGYGKQAEDVLRTQFHAERYNEMGTSSAMSNSIPPANITCCRFR